MWTKQLTVEGRVFYYNSTQNKSQWHPPTSVEVLHEAPFLSIPQAPSQNQQMLNDSSFQHHHDMNALSHNYQEQIGDVDSHPELVPVFGTISGYQPRDETPSNGNFKAIENRNVAFGQCFDPPMPALRY